MVSENENWYGELRGFVWCKLEDKLPWNTMTAIVSQLSSRGSHMSFGRRRVFGELDDVIHYSSFAPSTYFRTRDSSAKGVYGKIERTSPSPPGEN